VGGVQEVLRQIAERMAARGHNATVATIQWSSRDFDVIKAFAISFLSIYFIR
jgi:hypothetical protein